MPMARALGRAVLLAVATLAGSIAGDALRAAVMGQPPRQVRRPPGGDISITVPPSTILPPLLLAVLLKKRPLLTAFVSALLLSGIVSDRLERGVVGRLTSRRAAAPSRA